MDDVRLLERVWFGDDMLARASRLALSPLAAAYRGVVAARGALYDAGVLAAREPALPTLSVGNVSVGGTGKTPVAAWIARELLERGARPAVVLRGYGDDEPQVHRTLNPDVPVVVSADRAAGVSRARAAGATVAVLDDAFQHRGLARRADVVLVSADRWSSTQRLLPAGPWREPVRAIRRATLVVVTRKAASLADADRVDAELARIAPDVPRATLQLAPASLVDASRSGELALDRVAGRPIRVLAGIADPSALLRQLEALGGRVTADVYPDHHDFSEAEIERFSQSIPADGLAICTLKDAVKVGVRWPRAAPTLWYVSQHVRVERGADGVERMLDDLARAHDRT